VKHPAETELALYAGGDLGWLGRLAMARHLRRCGPCSRLVDEFRGVCEVLKAGREELPPDLEASAAWSEAAAAMEAGIRRGVAAARSPARPPQPARNPWRAPALAFAILLVILAGWVLRSLPPGLPPSPAPVQAAGALVLDASPTGIGVERDGRGFRLLRPQAARNVEVSVRGDSVRTRYVDAETGQVTISHVYAE